MDRDRFLDPSLFLDLEFRRERSRLRDADRFLDLLLEASRLREPDLFLDESRLREPDLFLEDSRLDASRLSCFLDPDRRRESFLPRERDRFRDLSFFRESDRFLDDCLLLDFERLRDLLRDADRPLLPLELADFFRDDLLAASLLAASFERFSSCFFFRRVRLRLNCGLQSRFGT